MVELEECKPGRCVRLVSGSPKMAIERVSVGKLPQGQKGPAPRLVHVVWYNDRLGLQRAGFAPEILDWTFHPVMAERVPAAADVAA